MNGMSDVRVHHDRFVKRPVVSLGTVGTLHRHIQGHATFDRKISVGDLACKVTGPLITQFRQEAHVASVDTQQRNVQGTRA